MKIKIDNELYDVIINKKISTKNLYIRVKDDLVVYVTCNVFTSEKEIVSVINNNILSIKKMIQKVKNKKVYDNKFYYLGKEYDLIYINDKDICFGDNKLFINKDMDINKFLKKQAAIIFREHLDNIYKNFSVNIPYPSLTIRKMKSRWGVCNTKTRRITLNLELIKKTPDKLDYVIIHELSHLVHPNHSNKFWKLVEENCPNYKNIRKEMKEY